MAAVILSIGDELVLGQTIDTNAAWLSERLAVLGVATRYHQTLPDDRAVIASALRRAADSELVIVTGGIGPTEDDLTREALADAMDVGLESDLSSLERIECFFRERGQPIPQRNAIQAQHPIGSTVIPNECGTAPGIRATVGGATVYVTPGVPREMMAMFQQSIEPQLRSNNPSAGTLLTCTVHSFGAGESAVAQQLSDLTDRNRNPTVGTTVGGGIVSIRIRSSFPDPRRARDALEDTAHQVEQRLGPIVFGRNDQTLPDGVLQTLRNRGETVATAESCTGGLVGKLLTDIPGSSAIYVGSWVTYSNQMKTQQLGVPASLIQEHGAVSEPVVREMAIAARQRSGADRAIAVTGVAGPDGGTPQKPVGSVWVGLADARETHSLLLNLPGTRSSVRDRAAKCALQLLRLQVLGESLDHITWVVPAHTP